MPRTVPRREALHQATMSRRIATIQDFDVGDEIAWGSLATISVATHKRTGKVYALKVLNKMHLARKKMVRSAMMEKEALVTLCSRPELHPGIVRLHYCFHDPVNLFFVLDLAPNGDLKEMVLKNGPLSLECARFYTAQMVDAILFMHKAGVVHRDIKPENCLLDESMRIKVADFGSAYVNPDLETYRTSTFVGTAMFISPEMLSRSKCDPKGPDIWAIGVCLFFYLFGTYPFAAATDYLVMERIKKLDYAVPEGCEPEPADLIKKLLVSDPADRLGMKPHSSPKALRDHAFFASPEKIEWEKLWECPVPKIEPNPALKGQLEDKNEDDLLAKFEELQLVHDDNLN
ncbi:hypothetical protein D9611_010439 [Ephemerocybe angulata]|uniref:non-specific serine/threonine protein kinase n=1 Tax=Ephemerocybe angulata TaxID=980116 RepID=A0A8H5BUY4_9AGAR|nr:hypothetical protein D9611_010439 [Tulosesus angulatus]